MLIARKALGTKHLVNRWEKGMTFKQLSQPAQIICFECLSSIPLWLLLKKANFIMNTTFRFKKKRNVFKVVEAVLGFSRWVLHLGVLTYRLEGGGRGHTEIWGIPLGLGFKVLLLGFRAKNLAFSNIEMCTNEIFHAERCFVVVVC